MPAPLVVKVAEKWVQSGAIWAGQEGGGWRSQGQTEKAKCDGGHSLQNRPGHCRLAGHAG